MPVDSYVPPSLGPSTLTTTESARQRLRQCAQSGLLRIAVDKRFGGFGDGFAALVDAHAALGRDTRDPGLVLAINAHLWGAVYPLTTFGNDEQRARWLPGLLDGTRIGGHAITEPGAGSDVQAMTTTACRDGDGFRLNGHKRYITNTPIADVMIVYARLDASPGLAGFVVEPGDAGVTFAAEPVVAGCRTATMGDVILDDVHLDASRLLGSAGAGGTMIQSALERERAYIFAGILGVMQWQLAHVVASARERSVGKGRLADLQAIAHRMADMKLRLDTVELWVARCAALSDVGQRLTLASAQTKLLVSEAFLQSSLDAVQIMGARGLESGMSTLVEDAMAGRLFSGSSEIQKNIIGAVMGIGLDTRKERG